MNDLITIILSFTNLESQINKTKIIFFIHIIELNLSFFGRFNFLNMARFGKYNEKTYRNNFTKYFPFLTFNIAHIKFRNFSEVILAGDATYIKKSGTKTYGLGYFWSGVASKVLKGLELHVISAIDVNGNQSYHLHALQTPLLFLKFIVLDVIMLKKTKDVENISSSPLNKSSSLANRTEFYIYHFISNAKLLLTISKYVVYDGFAYKFKFVSALCAAGFEVISKTRKDAKLYYPLTKEEKEKDSKKGRGAKRKYGKQINLKNPNLDRFCKDYEDEKIAIYSLIVYAPVLKIKIKISYCINLKTKQYVVLFSTDLKLSGEKIFVYYKSRFQIEFMFRDAKQYTGLEHFQARSEKKINYHFNIALISLSLEKTLFYQDPNNKDKPFSMRNIKISYYNKLVAKFIFSDSAILLTTIKIKELFSKLEQFGKIIPRKNREKPPITKILKKE